MSALVDRIKLISAYADELVRRGASERVGPVDRDVLFLLDGVGGLQAGPLLARRALRLEGLICGTILYSWQYGVPGEIWTDLMWLRRNRVVAAKLTRKLLAFRRSNPETRIHMLAFSGGAGIAVFACEQLDGRSLIDTLILAGPALSPDYNLGRALRAVTRCYALISHRDTWILGVGTRLFGTIDRFHCAAAGKVGFRIPAGLSSEDSQAYNRLREIPWSPALGRLGHHGGHTSWASVAFLRRHLPSMLDGSPALPSHELIGSAIADHRSS